MDLRVAGMRPEAIAPARPEAQQGGLRQISKWPNRKHQLTPPNSEDLTRRGDNTLLDSARLGDRISHDQVIFLWRDAFLRPYCLLFLQPALLQVAPFRATGLHKI
jgi:hypothetical protein